jgi:hypothetical protein
MEQEPMDRNTYDDIRDGVGYGPAFREADQSDLPGRHNGPADAYRHILGAAELTRRHGETAARALLNTNEIQGDISGQPKEERRMDEHNNEIGIAIGKESRTYDDVVHRAREKINQGVAGSGDRAEGSPMWLKESQWEGGGNNWPPDWNRVKPITTDYEYGGEKYRYRPRSELDPMDRPVETWSEDDVRAVMASDAYQRTDAPGHAQAQEKVRDWFVHFYGDGPTRHDATGRLIDPAPILPIPKNIPEGGGAVHVRAHVRDGGKVAVDAHDRSPPSR